MSHVEGFSNRFRELLKHTSLSEGKRHGLYTRGAEYLGVSRNTFKAYCQEDAPPKHDDLIAFVEKFLDDGVSGDHDARNIAAWLLFGDEIVENPLVSASKSKETVKRAVKSHA